jgi:hypothetical protein
MNDPRARQIAFNAESRHQWENFAGHRQTATRLLCAQAAHGGRRLCVLGAGNCNDLDLVLLLKSFREVHLVDLDTEALALGVARQGVANDSRLHCHGGLDLTGALDAIATWSAHDPIPPEQVQGLAEWPGLRVAPALPRPFDVVASICLLSQLIGNAFHATGERHSQFLSLVQAIRAGHLRLLCDLTAPGGTVLLITDVVSSDTFPSLGALPDSALPELLPRLARERNYFHGLNPALLPSIFQQDPILQARVIGLEPVAPWRWNLHDRVYLVWALKARIGPK